MRSLIRSIRLILWVGRLVFRFFSGRPMSGERKTDATFWTPATRSLDPSGKALRWEMMRGAARAAWRLAFSYLLLILITALLLWPLGSILSLPWWATSSFLLLLHGGVTGGALLGWGGRRIVREYGAILPVLRRSEEEKLSFGWRRVEGRRDWRREKLLPISRSASVITGHSIPSREVEKWVYVSKDYREGGMVRLSLPPHFTGADEGVKKRLVSSISAKLGTPGMTPSWMTEGSSPALVLHAPPAPPEKLSFSDVKEWLMNSEEYRPFLGLAGGSKPFNAEMVEDSPHTGLSAGPGAGKSTMAKLVIAQALRWGWGVIVIDWKQSSAFDWLGGLEGVTYVSDIEKIHDMGVRLAEEIDERKHNGMGGKAKILVVRDEWNVTAPLLYDYYAVMRSTAEPEEKRAMPTRSPALSGYAMLDFAGREFGMFDFCVAQKFSARIFNGNADIRECFNIKLMARYSTSAVKMLAPDIKPFPRKSNHVGRWVAVVGDEATVLQSPFLTSAEARSLAASGRPNPKFPLGRDAATQHVEDREYLGDSLSPDATPTGDASSDVNLPQGFKLSELVEHLEYLNVTHNVLRNAARGDQKGDPDFPAPIAGDPRKGYQYSLFQVSEWAKRRHAKMTAEKAAK